MGKMKMLGRFGIVISRLLSQGFIQILLIFTDFRSEILVRIADKFQRVFLLHQHSNFKWQSTLSIFLFFHLISMDLSLPCDLVQWIFLLVFLYKLEHEQHYQLFSQPVFSAKSIFHRVIIQAVFAVQVELLLFINVLLFL